MTSSRNCYRVPMNDEAPPFEDGVQEYCLLADESHCYHCSSSANRTAR